MAHQFDASSIKPIRWGEVRELPSGAWEAMWTIELETLDSSQVQEVADSAVNAEAGFSPTLTQVGSTTIAMAIETTRWSKELDYFELTYRLLTLIDSSIGKIRLVNGTPRDWWQPFRAT